MLQLIIIRDLAASKWTEPNRRVGDVVWINNMIGARHLIENGFAKWPEAGPTEKPEFQPSEKKFYGDLTDGPSTDSPLSKKRGQGKPLSVSAAVLVLPQRLLGK